MSGARLRSEIYAFYLVVLNMLLAVPFWPFRKRVLRIVARVNIMDAWVSRRVVLLAKGGLIIQRGSMINEGVTLDTRGGITIGEHCSISRDVTILTASHDTEDPDFAGFLAPVVIRDRVWIGVGALVCPGVTLGEGCVVGAGSVVTRSIPPWVVAAGNPARPLRRRSLEAQRHLAHRAGLA